MLYLPYVGMPNILAGERLVPELLQDEANPGALAANVDRFAELVLVHQDSLRALDRRAVVRHIDHGGFEPADQDFRVTAVAEEIATQRFFRRDHSVRELFVLGQLVDEADDQGDVVLGRKTDVHHAGTTITGITGMGITGTQKQEAAWEYVKFVTNKLNGVEQVFGGERLEHYETERVTKDGRQLDVWLAVSPVPIAQTGS